MILSRDPILEACVREDVEDLVVDHAIASGYVSDVDMASIVDDVNEYESEEEMENDQNIAEPDTNDVDIIATDSDIGPVDIHAVLDDDDPGIDEKDFKVVGGYVEPDPEDIEDLGDYEDQAYGVKEDDF